MNLEKRKANTVDYINMKLAVFDINTLEKFSDERITDKSKFF